MKYWPMMTLARSPLMPTPYVYELLNFYVRPPSRHAFDAALMVAERTPPLEMPNLAVIETIEGSYHRTYTGRPKPEEFIFLERGGVLPFDDGTMFIFMDVLH